MEDKNYYEQAGISNSSLSFLCQDQNGSRLKYKKNYVDGEREEFRSPSLENGKLIHLYIEDPDKFIVADIDKPSGMMGELVEAVYANHGFGEIGDTIVSQCETLGLYKSIKKKDTLVDKFEKDGREYYNHLVNTGDKDPELVLTGKQKELIENCVNSLKSNPNTVSELFEVPEGVERHNEFELYWNEEHTSQKMACKGMIDILDIDFLNKKVIIKDFKTTGKSIAGYKEAFEYWHTYRQLAFYAYGLRKVMPEIKNYKVEFQVIAIETTGLNECRVFEISEEQILKGIEEYISLLDEIAEGRECNWSSEFIYQNEVI